MVVFAQQKLIIRLDFLLCSLLVLVPTDELFKKFNLRGDVCLNVKEQNYILDNWKEIKILLNDEVIRKFSYILVRPLIFRSLIEDKGFIDNEKEQELIEGEILLKKYLKKFRAFYRHYFLTIKGNRVSLLTDKDINSFAIETLFLLVGV